MLRTRTSALAGRADAHSSSPFHRPLAAQLLDEQNPFLDEAAEDAAAREPMNPVKRAKHDLAIALGEYDPELEGRAAWRHLPRSFTASDCGSSPLRRCDGRGRRGSVLEWRRRRKLTPSRTQVRDRSL